MTIQITGGLTIPPTFYYDNDAQVFQDNNGITGLASWPIGFVITVPRTGVLHGFMFSAALFWQTGYNVEAAFWNVDDATGLPTVQRASGTFNNVHADVYGVRCQGLTDNGIPFPGSYLQVDAGDLIACTLMKAGSVGGIQMRTLLRTGSVGAPYAVVAHTPSGPFVRQASTHCPYLVLRYVTGVDILGVWNSEDLVTPLGCLTHEKERTFSDPLRFKDVGDEAVPVFQIPWSAEVEGVELFSNQVVNSVYATTRVDLMEEDETILGTGYIDGHQSADANRAYHVVYFPTPVTLLSNRPYKLAVRPTANRIAVYESIFDTTYNHDEHTGSQASRPGGPFFDVYDIEGSFLVDTVYRQLRFSLIATPQIASGLALLGSDLGRCGNAITVDGCVTAVPDDPAQVASIPAEPGDFVAVGVIVTCGRPITGGVCDTLVPDDPAQTATPPFVATEAGFASPLFWLGMGNDAGLTVGALGIPTECGTLVPAYCDSPES